MADELTEEQRRALAFREQQARREAFRRGREQALRGDEDEARKVRIRWRPLWKKPGDTSIP